jgi:4'-phosphopantetheinyl transferase EntD
MSHRPNPALDSPLLASLFPAGVAAAELRVPGEPGLLLPEEAQHVARATSKRVGDFAAGRLCARRALAHIGMPDAPLPVAEDRQPLWPAGIIGSITHTAGYGGAVVARRGALRALGIDAENVGRVGAHLWPKICTEEELAWLADLPAAAQARAGALVFSAKEAFYKCQYVLSRQWLGFHDVSLERPVPEADAGRFAVRLHRAVQALPGARLEGCFRFQDGLVVTGMSL